MIKVEILGGDFKGHIGYLMLHPLRGYVVYILTLGEDFDFEAEDLKLVPPDTALSEDMDSIKKPVMKICDSCYYAAMEAGASSIDKEVEQLLKEVGADIADHDCDNIEVGPGSCDCPCKK